MNISGEYLPQLLQPPCQRLSCLISCGGRELGIDRHSGVLYSMSEGLEPERLLLSQSYDRITYCPQTSGYFAICRCVPSCIFVLNSCFREIDRIRVSLDTPLLTIEDIWFDQDTQLLWLVTETRIYQINSNGDLLGAFITAPPQTEYKAVCSYHHFLFVALAKGGCLSLVSYTDSGVYLERVSIGNEYTVCNQQVMTDEGGAYLRMLALRECRFSVILKIELNCEKKELPSCEANRSDDVCVELETKSPQLHATCLLDTAPYPGNHIQRSVIG